jgi:hypothetical protein
MMDRNWEKASISDLEFSDYPLSNSFDELRCVTTRLGFRRTPGHVSRVWFVRYFELNILFQGCCHWEGGFQIARRKHCTCISLLSHSERVSGNNVKTIGTYGDTLYLF